MSQNFVEIHVMVRGYVQGVGFRATVRNYARQQSLKGTVRNRPDGSVEIYAQGSHEELDRFIKHLKGGAGLGLGHVDSVSVEYIEHLGTYEHFIIQ